MSTSFLLQDGMTVLHLASKFGQVKVIDMLWGKMPFDQPSSQVSEFDRLGWTSGAETNKTKQTVRKEETDLVYEDSLVHCLGALDIDIEQNT